MKFYKIAQQEIKKAHIDVSRDWNNAQINAEVREQLSPEDKEICQLMAEIGALMGGGTLKESEAKDHSVSPPLINEEQVVDQGIDYDSVGFNPVRPKIDQTTMDTPAVKTDDLERKRQQQQQQQQQRETLR